MAKKINKVKETPEIYFKNNKISIVKDKEEDFICLTDIARYKNPDEPKDVIKNWLRNKNTIEFLGLWEKINNVNFKGVASDSLLSEAGFNSFTLSSQKWIENTNAIGLISKSGKTGGTYAHKDIALEFAAWISAEFKLYLLKEFQRLKKQEEKNFEWNVKRTLSKINYKIHTDAIKQNLIPKKISINPNIIYANEADILNLALFNITAKDWEKENQNKIGNIRDYASVEQLIVLSNLESINSELIKINLNKDERLKKLNEIAISQLNLIINNNSIKKLK